MTKKIENTKEQNAKIVTAKLSQLTLSPLNPRQKADPEKLLALAISIKTVGLLQNLIGIQQNGTIEIVAGGRRLQAMKHLVSNDDMKETDTILVKLADNEEDAIKWAAAENEARENLTPAQEVRSYRAMGDAGLSVKEIANANAKTVKHVQGRLKLADLPDVILNALDGGDITLDTASAYTVSDNPEKQTEVFEANKDNYWNRDNGQFIKRQLLEQAIGGSDMRAKFVTREIYEEAGGAITEDLFSEDIYFDDSDLLNKLAEDKMKVLEADLIKQGWKWANGFVATRNYELIYNMESVQPISPELTEQNQTRLEMLEQRANDEEASEQELAEYADLEKLAAPFFTDEQRKMSGVIIYLSARGEVDLHMGMIDNDDIEEAVEAGFIKTQNPTKTSSKDEDTKSYSQALTNDLAIIKTGALQQAILENPEYAQDLAIFSLVFVTFGNANPISITSTHYKNEVEEHGQNLTDDLAPNFSTPLNTQQTVEAFAQFREMSDKQKLIMLTEAVAKATCTGLIRENDPDHLATVIASDLNLNVRETWTPNSTFFNRLKSPQLDDLMAYILDKPASKSFVSSVKRDKVARLHAIFNNEVDRRGFSDDQKERIAQWLPEGMETRISNITKLENKPKKNGQTPNKTVKKKAA